MKSKASRKHHYLPVFYLNGFTNSNGNIFVYNKKTDSIIGELSPSSIFFEKDINNFKHEGKIIFSTEDSFYMNHDSRASAFLNKYLQNKTPLPPKIAAEYNFELTWFIINLFWRIPNSNKRFEEIILKNGIHNKYFQLINRKTNKSAPDETIAKIQSDILNKSENRKIFKLIYPFISADSEEMLRIMEMVKDFSMIGEYELITGDNPFISNSNGTDIENILGEIIFPLSHERLVIAAKKIPTYINLHLLININLTIIHQSERFVCSHSIDNLNYMIKFYKIYKEENLLDTIAERTFELLYELSLYKNLEDYLKSKASIDSSM